MEGTFHLTCWHSTNGYALDHIVESCQVHYIIILIVLSFFAFFCRRSFFMDFSPFLASGFLMLDRVDDVIEYIIGEWSMQHQ